MSTAFQPAAYQGAFEKFTEGFAAEVATRAAQYLVGPRSTNHSKPVASSSVTVADLACGSGAATFAFANALRAAATTAALEATGDVRPSLRVDLRASDINRGMVELVLAEAATKRRELFCGNTAVHGPNDGGVVAAPLAPPVSMSLSVSEDDMETLATLESNSVDVVLCVFGIMFPPNPQQCVAQVRRVLKPGGVAFFVTWHYYDLLQWRVKLLRRVKGVQLDTEGILKFGREEFMRLLVEPSFGWSHAYVQCDFVQRAVPMTLRDIVDITTMSPLSAKYGPYDKDACVAALSELTGIASDVAFQQHGTALITTLTKPPEDP